MVSPFGASNFLYGQKVTKEPSKVGGISISLPPLKSPLLETTNQGGLRSPLLDVPPRGTVTWRTQRQNGPAIDETVAGCGPGAVAFLR